MILIEEFLHRHRLIRGLDETRLKPLSSKIFSWEKTLVQPIKKEQILDIFNKRFSPTHHRIIAQADQLCDHSFDLLGSGNISLGKRIHWHTDFQSGFQWNLKTYFKRIRPAPYPGGYEIKIPWELSRFQHLVRLGQAYWFTEDERYACEIIDQIEDWIDQNPWPWGVNWASTMDVAIRVANWLTGFAFIVESERITQDFLTTFNRSLYLHGKHIYRNLENKANIANNHYLADLVGLIHLGIMCPHFDEAKKWLDFGTRELWREMERQFFHDGVNFEGSIAYHRLSTELIIYAIILCQRNQIDIPQKTMRCLEKMLGFVMDYTKPDGTVPHFGDEDNGRLYRFKSWEIPEQEWNDHRYLLGLGAVLLYRNDIAIEAGDQWDEAIWVFGMDAKPYLNINQSHFLNSRRQPVKHYPFGGYHIIRNQPDHYMMIKTESTEELENSVHMHNDALSFEFFANGVSWIVDPGSYTYTSDYETRHLFRSTAYHSTPVLLDPNQIEQSEINAKYPFSFRKNIKCGESVARISERFICLKTQLQNYGNRFLDLERTVMLDCETGIWLIQDILPDQTFEHNFHFSHAVAVKIIEKQKHTVLLSYANQHLIVKYFSPDEVSLQVIDTWRSPGYGIKKTGLSLKTIIHHPHQIPTIVIFYPLETVEGELNLEQIDLEVENAAQSILNELTVN